MSIVYLLLWQLLNVSNGETSNSAPNTAQSVDSLLSVGISLAHPTVPKSGNIDLRVVLRNKSASDIYLMSDLDWGESASFSLDVRSYHGKEVVPDFIMDELPKPPTSKDNFLEIPPSGHIIREYSLPLEDLGVSRRGTYTIRVTYHSPVRAGMTFGLPVLTREMGGINSNRLTFVVK